MKFRIKGNKNLTVPDGSKAVIRKNVAPTILANYKELILDSIDERKLRNQDSGDILKPYLKYIKEIFEENRYLLDRLKETTMMAKILRKKYNETTQRHIHSLMVTRIGTEMATRLGLNVDLAELMLKYHDVGHTFYGHDGEWWISEVLNKKYNLGVLCHNAEGPRRLLYREGINEKIIEKIKQEDPNIKPWKLRVIKENLWVIFDGILTHNGELAKTTFIPNNSKTEADFYNDLQLCYTEKGADRRIVPGTIEGCLLRISDIISYVGRDFVDGLREGLIDGIDEEYTLIFNSFGISKEKLQEISKTGKYMELARIIENVAIEDVVANSSKKSIKMSDGMAKKIYDLRGKNNRDIVSKVTKETEQGVFPIAIESIMENGKNILINEGIIAELNENGKTNLNAEISMKYADSPSYSKFLSFVSKINPEEYKFSKQISETEVENAKANNSEPVLSVDEATALQISAQFLASMTDCEFVKFLSDAGELTVSQIKDLHVKYADTRNIPHSSIHFKKLMEEQEEEREKIKPTASECGNMRNDRG